MRRGERISGVRAFGRTQLEARWPVVIHSCQMSHTITIRLTKELAEWLAAEASRVGVSQGRIVRDQLENAKAREGGRSFMRLAGKVKGPRDLSQRRGFARE